jgi:hypothetical protein
LIPIFFSFLKNSFQKSPKYHKKLKSSLTN